MKKILLFATALLLAIPFNVIYADGDDPIEIIIGDGGSVVFSSWFLVPFWYGL